MNKAELKKVTLEQVELELARKTMALDQIMYWMQEFKHKHRLLKPLSAQDIKDAEKKLEELLELTEQCYKILIQVDFMMDHDHKSRRAKLVKHHAWQLTTHIKRKHDRIVSFLSRREKSN